MKLSSHGHVDNALCVILLLQSSMDITTLTIVFSVANSICLAQH